ncbi:MAG TPA: glycosyltransferase family 9 protein [Myxococcaceae bacterium]|nr:glycosyltransferase family 9 protein [Myxococcaceae bacterium]
MVVLLFHRGGIGDIVFGLPLIEDLRRAFPDARLVVLTHAQGEQVLRFCPRIDRIIAAGEMDGRWSVGEARSRLEGEVFDIALSTSLSPRAAYLMWRTGAGVRVGFSAGVGRALWTHRAPLRPFEVVFSRRYQRLAAALGIPATAELPKLEIPQKRREEARARLRQLGWNDRAPLISVHVGGGWPTKQWPVEHMAALAQLARQRHGATVLLQGGRGDRERANSIASSAKGLVLISVGNSISDAIAESAVCSVAIGIDSGLSHAAAACGTPTVFLFGPNEPKSMIASPSRLILTRNLECRPCNRAGRWRCPLMHHRCMREHSPESVLDAASPWILPRA